MEPTPEVVSGRELEFVSMEIEEADETATNERAEETAA